MIVKTKISQDVTLQPNLSAKTSKRYCGECGVLYDESSFYDNSEWICISCQYYIDSKFNYDEF